MSADQIVRLFECSGTWQLKASLPGLSCAAMTDSITTRYRVIRRVGSGGMGEVLLAEDKQLERRVALKIMAPALAEDENERKRFRMEAKAASGLSHPNICVIHEVGETEDGRPFLAMEYVDGQTLDVVEQQRRLRLREVIQIGIEVAEALQAAHDLHLVHRDIKPGNIMLDARGHVKVLDFGLAKKVAQEELGAVASTSAAHTRTGFLVGTPHYMSPEQVLGREVDRRTDIFSLGVVLYELVVGQRPFLGRTVGEVINNVVNQQPEPLGLENSLYSPALDRIIFKCLEKEPDHRYASARALAQDLAELRSQSDRETSKTAKPAEPIPGPAPVLAEPRRKPIPRDVVVFGLTLTLALAGIGLFLWVQQHRTTNLNEKAGGGLLPQKSVAVLPFDNFSLEHDTDYLSDGLTEEITSALSKVPGLKVVSRNSSFMFKGRREDLREVGRALHAGALIEGSVRKVGDKLRITAQLINAEDGYHLWSESYDRSMEDILAVQEDIARRIAEKLEGESASIKRQAIAPQEYKLYLQGKLFWNKRTATGLRKAVELYQQALEKDPTYAAAHAALASSYLLLPQYSEGLRLTQYGPLARASANRALELDPDCAEANAVLGMLQRRVCDCKGAEEHFRRAIQSEPSNATAHHWYGLVLEACGSRQEALEELNKALELDPGSPIIHSTIPEWYYLQREYDAAIAEAHKVIETFPDFAPARGTLVIALMMKGDYQQALDEIEKARAMVPDQPLTLLNLKGACFARMGKPEEARKVIAELEAAQKGGKSTEGAMAEIYLNLHDYDKAFALAEQVRVTEGLEPELLYDPLLDQFRNLPQFQALLQSAGLTNAPAP